MRTLYLDCFAGIAGDMFLGALLDMVPAEEALADAMKSLGLPSLHIDAPRRTKGGIDGIDVKVHLHDAVETEQHRHHHDHHHDQDEQHHHHDGHGHHHNGQEHSHHHSHRGLKEILAMLEASSLSPFVKKKTAQAFRLLVQAEGAVHGCSPEEVHFHEVGAWDSIADLTGAFVVLERLGVDRVMASPINIGGGTVRCAHGVMPVPAPATAKLLEGLPVFSAGEPVERTTPTGAALLRCLVEEYGSIPSGTIVASGIGHGDRETEYPNFLRALLIESNNPSGDYESGQVAVLETNVDDMNPQDFQPLMDRLFKAGALDVFLTSLHMKKGRPGIRITAVSPPRKREALGRIMVEHSTTLGVRWRLENRMTARREIVTFESSLGPVDEKRCYWGQEMVHRSFEFDDLHRIATAQNLSMDQVRCRITAERDGLRGQS